MCRAYSLREYKSSDLEKVIKVYKSSIEETGPEKYTPEQVRVWASFAQEVERFKTRLDSDYTIVAEYGGELVSFGSIESARHISLMFTLKKYSGNGIATKIYRHLENYAVKSGEKLLTTEASLIARHFFERQGFVVLEKETVIRNMVNIDRYKMQKRLDL